jgi:rhamnulokinase
VRNLVAIDLGNSSGRVILGRWDGAAGLLREIYRFANGAVEAGGHIVWEVERIWREVLEGLRRAAAETGGEIESLGLDAWGAEHVLVDRAGELVGQAHCLRDPCNVPATERAFTIVPRKQIYEITGIQVMPINALYALLAHREEFPHEWDKAWRWLGTPEYYLFRLSGVAVAEYTNAPNSQLVDALAKDWSRELCRAFGLSLEKFPPIVPPGTVLGKLRPRWARELGLPNTKVIAPACHDTGAAVAAIPYSHHNLAFISSGTWSLVGTVLPQPLISDLGYEFNLTNEGGVGGTVRYLRNVIGLWLIQEVVREWNEQGLPVTEAELAEQCEGLSIEGPYVDLSDERPFLAPGNMAARMNAALREKGFGEETEPAALAGVIFRSLARRYAEVIEAVRRATGKTIERLCIVGGGVKNEALNLLAAHSTGLEVIRGASEATVLGNVAIQIAALENTRSVEDIQALASRLTFQHLN